MKKLLIIALCFTLTVQLSAQTQSDGRASVGVQNGSKHFDVAAHLRQLKINEMNSQARMKRVQSKPAALRTANPVHRNPGAVQPEKPVSMQPKAPARKAAPAASAKSRSTANNGGFWKFKEKLDSIVEDNGNQKRTFEYDYDGIVTNESVYRLRNDKTWSLNETNEYNYDDNNVIESKIHYSDYDYWDNKPHFRSVEYYDKFGYISSMIYYYYDNDEFVPNTKYEYYPAQWGGVSELKSYDYQDGEWVLAWDSHVEVTYDNEGRLIYICDTQNPSKYEYYYDENGNRQDKARYSYISEEVGFVCTYLVTLDENNRVISQEEYNTNWETGERQGNFKHEYAYGEDGSQTKTFYNYNWDVENGKWYDNPQEMTKYNKDGNVTLYENYTPNESYKNEYVYDEYSNCTKFFYWWDGGNGQWHEHPKTITKYDENGLEILYEDYNWDDNNNVWVAFEKYERYCTPAPSGGWYYYNDKAHYEVVNGEFICNYNAEIDDQKRIISEEWFNINDLGTAVPDNKYVYVYDDNGERHTTDYYYSWNSEMECYMNLDHYDYTSDYKVASYKESEILDGEYVVTSGHDVEFDDHGEVLKVTDVVNPDNYTEYENAYNESGQLISQISKCYEVSGLTSQDRHDFEYDDKGRCCLDLYSFWNGEGWTKNQKIEYNYEACDTYNVGVYQKTSYVYAEEWLCVYESGYLKLENGYKEVSNFYDYDWSTGDLTDCYIREYTFDAKGNQIGYKQASGVTEDGMPQVQQEAEYVYIRGNNRITSYQSEWDDTQNKLVEKRKSTTEKTEEGVTILTIQTSYDGTEWTTESCYELEYDEDGVIISSAQLVNNEGTFTRNGATKYAKKYDSNGHTLLDAKYSGDENGDWICMYKGEYEYDEFGNRTLDKYEHIEDWYDKHECRYVSFYNEETGRYNVYQTVYYPYYWSDDAWVGIDDAYTREYDANGNITKETRFRWDSENDEWYIQNQSSYTFDTNVLTADIAMKEGEYSQYNGKCKLLSLESSEYDEGESSYYDNKTEYFYSVFGYYYYVDGESHEIIPDGDEFVGEDLTLIDKQTYSANTDFTAHNLTYKRTFVDSEWNALYVPFNIPVETLDEEGLQAAEILTTHIYDDDQDGTVDRTTIEVVPVISGELEANVPYVVRAKELEGEKEVEINLSNILVHESENNSVDCSSTKQLFTFTGSYEPITGETLFTDGLYYIGINAETQNVAIVQAGSAETPSLPAQRWTLAVTNRFGNKVVSNVRAIDIIMDEDATGIEAIGAGAESATDVYNVAGVKVATMTAGQSIKNLALPAGVYVNKGHKFIIK